VKISRLAHGVPVGGELACRPGPIGDEPHSVDWRIEIWLGRRDDCFSLLARECRHWRVEYSSDMLGALTGSLFIWSLLGLAASHLISMFVNFYGKREYLARTPNKQMFIPYSRIALLHIVIILSGVLASAVGQGLAMLIVLVVVKIGFDLAAHLAEHAKVQRDMGGIVS